MKKLKEIIESHGRLLQCVGLGFILGTALNIGLANVMHDQHELKELAEHLTR